MPAFKVRGISPLCVLVFLILAATPIVGRAHASAGSSGSNTLVNLLINYGNGTLVWNNNTLVPSNSNYYNVTTIVTHGDIGANYSAAFGSHFVYSINGYGCTPNNIFCDPAWSFWTLDGICWDLPFVGVDQVNVSQATTAAWFRVPVATFGENPPTGVNCLNSNIKVNPRNNQTTINVGSSGNLQVAILSSSTFDATKVDPATVRFGRTGTEAAPINWVFQVVNHDGLPDLVLRFKIQSTGVQVGDTQAGLMGRTLDGTPFRGSTSIQAVDLQIQDNSP